MNFAHLHLIMNHIPIVGIPVALLFLGYGLWSRNLATQRFALMVLVGLAILTIPVYLTGEPAEKVAKHLPGVEKALIHEHEEAAEVSFILTLVTGAAALVALFLQQNEKKRLIFSRAAFALSVVAFVSLGYAGYLGGRIRHTEFSSVDGAPVAPPTATPSS